MQSVEYMANVFLRYGVAFGVFLYCFYKYPVVKKTGLFYYAIYILFFVLSSMSEQPLIVERLFNISDGETWLKITHGFTTITLLMFLNKIMSVSFKKHRPTFIISVLLIIISGINIIFYKNYIPVINEITKNATYASGVFYYLIARDMDKKGKKIGKHLTYAMFANILFILIEQVKRVLSMQENFENSLSFLFTYFSMTFIISMILFSLFEATLIYDEVKIARKSKSSKQ